MVMTAPPAQAQDTAVLKQRIDEAIKTAEPKLTGATIGVAVVDSGTGQLLYQKNADSQFNIASNAKLITASAALALLGPNYRFRTQLFTDKLADGGIAGDLYIRGQGDPSLDTARLYELSRRLRLLGVKRVTGAIVIDNSYFDNVDLPPHFGEQPKEEAYFRAPIGATSLNANNFVIRVRPSVSGTGPAQVSIDPETPYIKVTSTVTTVAKGRARVDVTGGPVKGGVIELLVEGQIHATALERRIVRRIPDPVAYLGMTLKAALKQHGISVGASKLKRAVTPKTARYLAEVESPPLSIVLFELGKYSDNYVAEMLLKNIGAASLPTPRPATWQDGLTAVHTFLQKEIGLKANSYRFDNGSGLYDASRFSPRQLTQLLRTALQGARWGPELVSSLAVAGVDGTLSQRPLLSAQPPYPAVPGAVRAKTGSLAQASALSGYAAVSGLKPLVFSILVSGFAPEKIAEARALQDAIARVLLEGAPK